MRRSYFAGTIGLLITLLVSHGRSTFYNNYVLLADAVLHGHLWIKWPGPYIDAVLYHGHRFIVNDPLPAVLMLPAVAIWGTSANQTLLAVTLCGIATGAAWELCERLWCTPSTAAWLTAFLLAGTPLLWCSMLGDVWFIAQTSCVAFTLLCLCELAGKNRIWLVTTLFACAIASRFTVVMAVPAIAALAIRGGLNREPRDWRALLRPRLIQAAAALLPFAALWATYNVVRWGVPWDAGHTIFFHEDASGSPSGSPFSLTHVPYQLWSFLVQRPDVIDKFPWLQPSISGVALTWTSPAFVLAFLGRRPRFQATMMWLATLLVAIPSLLYYVNGYAQFGMRHALDFAPFLFVLMIFGVRGRIPMWGKLLIAYSIGASTWGCWYWNTFIRNGS